MCGNEKLLMCVYVNKDTVYVENGYYTFFKSVGQISVKKHLYKNTFNVQNENYTFLNQLLVAQISAKKMS